MTADRWTHHDPAVRGLIRRAQADAWDEGVRFQQERSKSDPTAYSHNRYRDEVTR